MFRIFIAINKDQRLIVEFFVKIKILLGKGIFRKSVVMKAIANHEADTFIKKSEIVFADVSEKFNVIFYLSTKRLLKEM